MAKKLTQRKARKILKEGVAQGKPLTSKQKSFFGLVAGGGTPTRIRGARKKPSGRRGRSRGPRK